jgi:hypothetical protein
VSRLEPDELARLLTQAVEPIRPDPAAYQRIKDGIAWRRRWRLPGIGLAGAVAAALVALAVIAIQPGPSAQVVEPGSPLVSSLGGGTAPGAGSSYRGGSGGNSPGEPGGGAGGSPGTNPTSSASLTASAPPTASPSSSPTDAGSNPMPAPSAVPAIDGDVDGDGSVDSLKLAGTRLDVTMTRGGVASIDLPNAMAPLQATVVDLDRDGFGEIVLLTGAESGVKQYSVLGLAASDELRQVGPGPLSLVAGTDPARGVAYGFHCEPGILTTYSATFSATSIDLGVTFNVITSTWRLDGDRFIQVGNNSPGVSSTDRSQFTASCGNLP